MKQLIWRLTHRIVCDSCGKVNPELLRDNSRYTKCCAYNERESAGKTWTEKLQWPISMKWNGFWCW